MKRINFNEYIDMNELKGMNCQKWSGPVRFFYDFYLKLSSRYSFVHILSTSSSKSGLDLTVLYDFFLKSSSHYSLVHIFSTSSSKSGLDPAVFLRFFLKSSSRCSLLHILSTTFPDRGAQPRKQRPSSGDHGRPL